MTAPDEPQDPSPSSFDPDIAEAVNALGADAWWAVDIVPLLKPQENDPLARFAVLLVMAYDVVVYTEFVKHPGADHAVPLLLHALRSAAHKAGVWPDKVLVRGDDIDIAVQDAIDDTGEIPPVTVYGVARFSDDPHPAGAAVDQAILDLRHHMDGVMIPDVPASSSPAWMAWGIASEQIAALFRALANLYRAVQTRRFTDGDPAAMSASMPEARPPRAKGRGNGGALLVIEHPELLDSLAVMFGDDDTLATIMLFAAREDWEAMVEAGATDPVSADVRYPVSCISFVPHEELWGSMAEEIATYHWDVAGPAAYPTLWILNAAGGGMTTTYCTTMTAQLEAIARAITYGTSTPLHPEAVFNYSDEPSGLVIRTVLDAERDE